MKHYYQRELDEATARFRATMAAYQGGIDTEPRATATRKGLTLYIVSDEARELRRLDAVVEGR